MQTKFIIFIALVVLVVGGLGVYSAIKPAEPSKLDGFAQALKNKGAVFYGAFWCPHCLAQKAEFGSSKQFLPYVECSNTDNSQTQVCKDKQIESYPTWTFKDGIRITSNADPIICPIETEDIPATGNCVNRSSQYSKVWLFPDIKFSIKSPTDPVKNGNVWQFPPEAQSAGEIPLTFLAEQIQFTLPQ